jgi:hypothetical protein
MFDAVSSILTWGTVLYINERQVMSLIDSINEHYKETSCPPDGSDLDYVLENGKWVESGTTTVLLSEEDNDSARWGTWFTNVYQRDDEFVAVVDCRPATEMQDWGDYGAPEVYEVRSWTEVITVTHYDRIEVSNV